MRPVQEAAGLMVVDHADGLQIAVHRYRAHVAHAAAFQVTRDSVAKRRGCTRFATYELRLASNGDGRLGWQVGAF